MPLVKAMLWGRCLSASEAVLTQQAQGLWLTQIAALQVILWPGDDRRSARKN